jgi:sarcosine oxidase
VVGAGIMGAAAAWHLARRGHRLTLLEQYALDHSRGSSHGSSRIFRLGYEESDYVELAARALPLWREAERALGVELLRTTGALDIGAPGDLDPVAAALAATQTPFERLTADGASRRFPQHPVPAGWQMLYQPDGGVLLAGACCRGLIELARRAGADIRDHTRVISIELEGSGVNVQTEVGTWRADSVVVATAGWANTLLEPMGLHVPVRVTREHVAYYPHSGPTLPFIWHEGERAFAFYGLPNGDQREVKVGQHGAGPVTNPDEEAVVEAQLLEAVEAFARRHLPSIPSSAPRHDTCLYAATPDDDFVLDRIGPIVLGLGFGGHGFKFGSLVGAMLADLVTDDGVQAPARFQYGRFAADISV